MTHAFDLIRKVLLRQVPPRAALWGFLNKLNWKLGTGNRRYEFECLYLEHPDPRTTRRVTTNMKNTDPRLNAC